jgi:hypothetical protein
MKRITRLILAAASVCLLVAFPAQGNLVSNGDFETGSLSPWTPNIDTPTVGSSVVHSGTYAAVLGGTANNGIQQDVPTTAGNWYRLDFWARKGGTGTLFNMSVTFDGTLPAVLLAADISSTAWTHYSYDLLIGSQPTSTLLFNVVRSGTAYVYLDDVSVVQVPEATTMIAGALLLLPFGASTLRILRRRAAA